MKTFSVSQEALWGLKSFLGVVPANEIAASFPELGVKAVIRMEDVTNTIDKTFEGSDMQTALKTVDEKVKAYRSELIAPFEGQPIPPDQDSLLGLKLRDRILELQTEILTAEMKGTKLDFEVSDEKGTMLVSIFDKYASKFLISKPLIALIAKELGIEE
jgi:hypothetical protein